MCFLIRTNLHNTSKRVAIVNHFQATAAMRSEDEIGAKLDRCFADSLLKIGGGLAIGIVTSALLLKGRTMPIWLGVGIGKFLLKYSSETCYLRFDFRHRQRLEQLQVFYAPLICAQMTILLAFRHDLNRPHLLSAKNVKNSASANEKTKT